MAKSRFDNLEEEKRERLIGAAGREFAESGYERASLNDIIDRADFSKGSLYYYFEDKEDLYETVCTRAAERIASEFGFAEESLTSETFWDELEELTVQALKFVQRHDWYIELLRTLYRMRDRHPDGGPSAELFDAGQAFVEELLKKGQRLGVVRDDLPLGLIGEVSMGFIEACDRWMLRHYEDFDDEQLVDQSRRQFEMMRRMLEPANA